MARNYAKQAVRRTSRGGAAARCMRGRADRSWRTSRGQEAQGRVQPQSLRSSVRYWIASLRWWGDMDAVPSRAAMAPAISGARLCLRAHRRKDRDVMSRAGAFLSPRKAGADGGRTLPSHCQQAGGV